MAQSERVSSTMFTEIVNDAQRKEASPPASEKWKEFIENTTMHGLRNILSGRPRLVRMLWCGFMLTSSIYYAVTVYRALNKYLERPITTVLKTTHLQEMEFPAVTICPLNFFSKSKLTMHDNDPEFTRNGLNITSCAATEEVRRTHGNMTCGLAMVCCCPYPADEYLTRYVPNCTAEVQKALRGILNKTGTHLNSEEFYERYAQDMSIGSFCFFGMLGATCSGSDFQPLVTESGKCYTFNSGTGGKNIRKVEAKGTSNGLLLVLDSDVKDYTVGKYSQGFRIVIHQQGELIDVEEGINIGPGQHAVVGVCRKEFLSLPKPYATECRTKRLNGYTTYTVHGCFYECYAKASIKSCGCRPVGYKGSPKERVCSVNDNACYDNVAATFYNQCDCPIPCSLTTYQSEVSYSSFPNEWMARWYSGYKDISYQRENLVLLEIGFKSLSYDTQLEKPAYDINAFCGEIGGNMGLFLGCSLLTICEFIDFFISRIVARFRRNQVNP